MANQKQDGFLYRGKFAHDLGVMVSFLGIHPAGRTKEKVLCKSTRWSLRRSVFSILLASLILWLSLFVVIYFLSII